MIKNLDGIEELSFRRRALGRDGSSNNILEHGIAAGHDGWLPCVQTFAFGNDNWFNPDGYHKSSMTCNFTAGV